MKRHPALHPLSHDHHRALLAVRRVREGAAGDARARRAAGRAFADFFRAHAVPHFREEEELLFPLWPGEPPPQLVRALVDHVVLHRLVARLERELADPPGVLLAELGERLEAHVRLEERELFPALEAAAELGSLGLPPREPAEDAPLHRLAALEGGGGPLWGIETEDLNATLLAWRAGEGTPEHVNAERDVALVVLGGSGTLTVDGRDHPVEGGHAGVIPKGARRRLTAGPHGLRYLTVHRRRGGLAIAPAPPRSPA